MLSWKVILEVICVVIAAVLIFLFIVPVVMESIGTIHPIFFEIEEEIRCHIFQHEGICLSLYPKRPSVGSTVDVTIRAREWYNTQLACVWKEVPGVVVGKCCRITNGKCKTNFVVSADSTGTYFAFIDSEETEPHVWSPSEPNGERKQLVVIP